MFKKIWKFIKGLFIKPKPKPKPVYCITCKYLAKSFISKEKRNCLFEVIDTYKFPQTGVTMNIYEKCSVKNKNNDCGDYEK